jgi:HlyD family secretion protein
MLHFAAFKTQTTPEIQGTVSRIGADLSEGKRTGAMYYIVRVAIDQTKLPMLKGQKLVPGMRLDMFTQTEPRTVISYAIKPLKDQVARTFKES